MDQSIQTVGGGSWNGFRKTGPDGGRGRWKNRLRRQVARLNIRCRKGAHFDRQVPAGHTEQGAALIAAAVAVQTRRTRQE